MANPTLERHPLAGDFPELTGVEYEEFCNSIAKDGQREAAIIYQGKILDGWNRYRACVEMGVQFRAKELPPGTDENAVVRQVIASNIRRRHMTETQRAWTASGYVNSKHGGDQIANLQDAFFYPLEQGAQDFLVSERSISAARAVRRAIEQGKLQSQFADEIKSGRIAVSAAEQCIGQSKALQMDVLENPKNLRALLKQKKRDERDAKAQSISEALPEGTYEIVVCDPPWKFETRSEQGMDRSADNHYPTMTIADIAAKKPTLADSAVVFMWTTRPMLRKAFDILDEWGVIYKSCLVWKKTKVGTGYWARDNAEILLIATTEKGFPAPIPGDQLEACETHGTLEHSVKPAAYMEWIEATYPHAKKLEMYARDPRDGWDVWGLESDGIKLDDKTHLVDGEHEEARLVPDDDDVMDDADRQEDDEDDENGDITDELAADDPFTELPTINKDEDGPPL